MSTSPISLRSVRGAFALPGRLLTAVEALFGAAAVGLLGITTVLVQWAVSSNAWVFFFLATKPLIDLTWRWKVFQFSEQEVNPQTIVGLVVLGLNGIVILKRAAWRRLPRRVLLFLACATLSVVFSPSSWGFNELLRLLAGTTFFYTAGPLLAEARQFDRFRKVFLWAMAVPVLLTFFQVAGFLPYEYWDWTELGQIGRASGTYPTPLTLSFFLFYAFPLALSIADSKQQTQSARRWASLFLILASVALAFGNHRTSYFIIALQILTWLFMTRGRKAVLVFLVILAVVVILSFSWLQMLYAPLTQALTGNIDITSGEFLRGRGFQWFLFLNSYASSGPFHWVMGNGGSIIAGYDPHDPLVDSVEPHNDYIRILHAYGMVGLLLYLSVLALLLRKTFQLLRSPDEFARTVARVMLLALTAVIIQSVMMEPTRYPTGVWYLFALGSVLFCLGKNASPSQTRNLQP
ncbi:MAG TPA: O-antigen ligase family protein [Candidatus Acidoferrum sp.]|nr:O-antigen ligase family protein [Candidatus Acidoferrum sp.]